MYNGKIVGSENFEKSIDECMKNALRNLDTHSNKLEKSIREFAKSDFRNSNMYNKKLFAHKKFEESIGGCIKIAFYNSDMNTVDYLDKICPKDFVINTITDACCARYNSTKLKCIIEKYISRFNEDNQSCLIKIFKQAFIENDTSMLSWLITKTNLGSNKFFNNEIEKIFFDDILNIFELKPNESNKKIVTWFVSNIITDPDFCDSLFEKACTCKNFGLIKWILENSNDWTSWKKPSNFIFKSVNRGDFLLVDTLLSHNLQIGEYLDIAMLSAADNHLSKIVSKLIEYGADFSLLTLEQTINSKLYDYAKQIIDENNYLLAFELAFKSSDTEFEFINWIYDKFDGKNNTSKMFSFPGIDWKISPKINDNYIQCINLIIRDDYKLFVDNFLCMDILRYTNLNHELNLSPLQKHLLNIIMDVSSRYKNGRENTTYLYVNYSLFNISEINDFTLYLLYKLNDIRGFHILTHLNPNLYFEVDEKGKISDYSILNPQIKNARKV